MNKKDMMIKEKMIEFVKKFWKVIVVVSTLSGLLGITVLDIFHRDWQAIAEQYNTDGLELSNSGQYEKAIELYNKAIALEDKNIKNIDVCYYNRGFAYNMLNEYDHAIGDYTIAIQLNPRSKYYMNRSVVYEKMGNALKAAEDNEKALLTIGD